MRSPRSNRGSVGIVPFYDRVRTSGNIRDRRIAMLHSAEDSVDAAYVFTDIHGRNLQRTRPQIVAQAQAEVARKIAEFLPDNRRPDTPSQILDIMEAAAHPQPDNYDFLSFTASGPATVKYTPSAVSTAEYSFDREDWFPADRLTVPLADGETVYYRGNIRDAQGVSYAYFSTTGTVAASGSVMSLYDRNPNSKAIRLNRAFYGLFDGCTSLITPPFLPATMLSKECYRSMFQGCTSLLVAPELPAPSLKQGCYQQMFFGCQSLELCPDLLCQFLAVNCYNEMFRNCISLTVTPFLPAIIMMESCYQSMFEGCTSLVSTTTLPATALASHCYDSMFSGCTSLVDLPSLPATKTAPSCYAGMFRNTAATAMAQMNAQKLFNNCFEEMYRGCEHLRSVVALPATTLASACYHAMFQGCISLITPPNLPAETLVDDCYSYMFADCTALMSARCGAFAPEQFCNNMFLNIHTPGCYHGISEESCHKWRTTIPREWYTDPLVTDPLTITFLEAGTFCYTQGSYTHAVYSFDGEIWYDADGFTVPVSAGQQVYFQGLISGPQTPDDHAHFNITAPFELNGSVMSLQDMNASDTAITHPYAFYGLFENQPNLMAVDPGFLPATTLTPHCYERIFALDSSLEHAPILPATELPEDCYKETFAECTSLVDATAMAADPGTSCTDMFRGITTDGTFYAQSLEAAEAWYDTIPETWHTHPASRVKITVIANDPAWGTVTGTGVYPIGTEVTISATPGDHRKFYFWEDEDPGSYDNPRTVIAGEQPRTYKAMFSPEQFYQVEVKSDTEGCLTEGSGEYRKTTTAHIRAIADDTHIFVKWSDGSTDPVRDLQINEDLLLIAEFREKETYEVALTASPEEGGTVEGSGSYPEGTHVEIKATPNFTYKFVKWSDGSTDPERLLVVDHDYTLTAEFEQEFDPVDRCLHIAGPGSVYLQQATGNVKYSRDCQNWESFSGTTPVPLLSSGLYIKGDPDAQHSMSMSTNIRTVNNIGTEGVYTISGNVMSMFGLTDELEPLADSVPAYGLLGLFQGFSTDRHVDVTNLKMPSGEIGLHGCTAMFYGVSKLLSTPELPALVLGDCAYEAMFQYCEQITSSSALPATSLGTDVYFNMFRNCTSLKTSPDLMAETLAPHCYRDMFHGCTSLENVGVFGATTLALGCCYEMFRDCVSLKVAPNLPAPSQESCYNNMFKGCTSLVSASIDGTPSFENTFGMFEGIETTDYTFGGDYNSWKYSNTHDSRGMWGIPESWAQPINGCYVTGPGKVGFDKIQRNMWYSFDEGATWNEFTEGGLVELPEGQKMYIKGPSNEVYSYYSKGNHVIGEGDLYFHGSIMSLLGMDAENQIISPDATSPYCFKGLFTDCDALKQAPELPATNISERCYQYMFQGCSSLTEAPALPATAVYEESYRGMFKGCTSLTSAPELPATTMNSNVSGFCYSEMFRGCSSLTEAPELPAESIPRGAYESMFSGCASLTKAPSSIGHGGTTDNSSCAYMFAGCESLVEPPVIDAAPGTKSYMGMFMNCSSMVVAPELPYTELAGSCYKDMFKYCTSLTTPPQLPAGDFIHIDDEWYAGMFGGCTSLRYIELNCKNPGWNYHNVEGMFEGIETLPSTVGGLHLIGEDPTTESSILEAWKPYLPESWWKEMDCMYFTGNGTVGLSYINESAYYSTDNGMHWENFVTDHMVPVPENGRLYVKGSQFQTFSTGWNNQFKTTGDVGAHGNVMSMLGMDDLNHLLYTDTVPEQGLASLFHMCPDLTSAPDLPATHVGRYAYHMMFYGCESLETPPALPATDIGILCYNKMFVNCKNLKTCPALPAITLRARCYEEMFTGCTSITDAPALPALELQQMCYTAMFKGCTSLTNPPELPAYTLVNSCYSSMFEGCASLDHIVVNAPEPGGFCQNMFNGIETAPSHPGGIRTPWEYDDMDKSSIYDAWEETIPESWKIPALPLCFSQAYESSFKVQLSPKRGDVQYSLDRGATWTSFPENSEWVEVPAGKKMLVKGEAGLTYTETERNGFHFQTNRPDITGNILSLFGWQDNAPVTDTVPDYGCYMLFYNNTMGSISSLVLPATTPGKAAFAYMFGRCNTLATTPVLPAMTLSEECYKSMFYGCFGIKSVPENLLPATTLAPKCYSNMFDGCTQLKNAPALPATTLSPHCYDSMFITCYKLEAAPQLPATTLVEGCYNQMFSSCEKITEVWINAAAPGTNCNNMFANITTTPTTTGGIHKIGEWGDVESDIYPAWKSTIPASWKIPDMPLCFSGESLKLAKRVGKVYYSLDNCATWTEFPDSYVSIPYGKFLFIKGEAGHTYSTSEYNWFQVGGSMGRFAGSVLSLFGLDASNNFVTDTVPAYGCYRLLYQNYIDFVDLVLPETTPGEYAYAEMLAENMYINTFPKFPAMTVSKGCMSGLFKGSTNLERVPVDLLPATTLGYFCYDQMFQGCTALENAPELPATTVVTSCYKSMFMDCSNLRVAPALPATTTVSACYEYMFKGCVSLQAAPDLPATTLGPNCYEGMFTGCTYMVTPPAVLPATTLTTSCYREMFMDCACLEYAPELPAASSIQNCYRDMFKNCENLSHCELNLDAYNSSHCAGMFDGIYAYPPAGYVGGIHKVGEETTFQSAIYTGWEEHIPLSWRI